jgi:hypothetical protein
MHENTLENRIITEGHINGRHPGQYDRAGKQPRQHPEGRRCITCQRPLSRYNPTIRCESCTITLRNETLRRRGITP